MVPIFWGYPQIYGNSYQTYFHPPLHKTMQPARLFAGLRQFLSGIIVKIIVYMDMYILLTFIVMLHVHFLLVQAHSPSTTCAVSAMPSTHWLTSGMTLEWSWTSSATHWMPSRPSITKVWPCASERCLSNGCLGPAQCPHGRLWWRPCSALSSMKADSPARSESSTARRAKRKKVNAQNTMLI